MYARAALHCAHAGSLSSRAAATGSRSRAASGLRHPALASHTALRRHRSAAAACRRPRSSPPWFIAGGLASDTARRRHRSAADACCTPAVSSLPAVVHHWRPRLAYCAPPPPVRCCCTPAASSLPAVVSLAASFLPPVRCRRGFVASCDVRVGGPACLVLRSSIAPKQELALHFFFLFSLLHLSKMMTFYELSTVAGALMEEELVESFPAQPSTGSYKISTTRLQSIALIWGNVVYDDDSPRTRMNEVITSACSFVCIAFVHV